MSPAANSSAWAAATIAEDFVVYTHPVDLRELEEDSTVEVAVVPPRSPFRLGADQTVAVEIQIHEKQTQTTLELSVRVDNAPEGTTVLPNVVTVTVRGPLRIVTKLELRDYANHGLRPTANTKELSTQER